MASWAGTVCPTAQAQGSGAIRDDSPPKSETSGHSTQPNPANPNPTAAWLRGIPSPRPRPCPLVPYIPNPKAPVATYALRTSLSPLQPSPAAFHPKPYLARPWSTAIYSAQQSTKAGIDEGPSSKKRANTPYASYAVVTYVASSPPSTAAQSPAWPSGW